MLTIKTGMGWSPASGSATVTVTVYGCPTTGQGVDPEIWTEGGVFAFTEIVTTDEPVPAAFVAPIVTVLVPTAVGAPEMIPVVVLTDKPGGRFVALKEVGLLDAVIWKLNDFPVTPAAVVALVMDGAARAAPMEIDNVAEPVPVAFVAPMVTGLLPDAVGVPEITPVAALTDSPTGRPVAL